MLSPVIAEPFTEQQGLFVLSKIPRLPRADFKPSKLARKLQGSSNVSCCTYMHTINSEEENAMHIKSLHPDHMLFKISRRPITANYNPGAAIYRGKGPNLAASCGQ